MARRVGSYPTVTCDVTVLVAGSIRATEPFAATGKPQTETQTDPPPSTTESTDPTGIVAATVFVPAGGRPDGPRRRDGVRRRVDPADGAVLRVRHPDRRSIACDAVRGPTHRDRRRHRVGGRVDPADRAVIEVRHPDGRAIGGESEGAVAHADPGGHARRERGRA